MFLLTLPFHSILWFGPEGLPSLACHSVGRSLSHLCTLSNHIWCPGLEPSACSPHAASATRCYLWRRGRALHRQQQQVHFPRSPIPTECAPRTPSLPPARSLTLSSSLPPRVEAAPPAASLSASHYHGRVPLWRSLARGRPAARKRPRPRQALLRRTSIDSLRECWYCLPD